MPPISETQKKALVRLCSMRGGEYHPEYPVKEICRMPTGEVLEELGFIEACWGTWSLDNMGRTNMHKFYLLPTSAGRAYVELLKEIEKLKEKKNEHRG